MGQIDGAWAQAHRLTRSQSPKVQEGVRTATRMRELAIDGTNKTSDYAGRTRSSTEDDDDAGNLTDNLSIDRDSSCCRLVPQSSPVLRLLAVLGWSSLAVIFVGCVQLWKGISWTGTGVLSPEVAKAMGLFWLEALEGGLSGAAAMVVQVITLLWLRTTMNYQYKHGGSFTSALSSLYREGGVRRLYAGLLPALIQGPLSRFGDTAANDGVRAALKALEATSTWSSTYVSVICSLVAGAFRVMLMPLVVVKTSMQVQGAGAGLASVRGRISRRGMCALWEGLIATFGAHFAGHLPWFGTRDLLLRILPSADTPLLDLGRSAAIGLVCSLVADLISNPFRVIKTCKQTSEERLTYSAALYQV